MENKPENEMPAAPAAQQQQERLHNMYVRNIARITEVYFEPPAEGLVTVGGENAAGKTSLMVAIGAALGGKVPDLRDGQESGEIKLELTNYTAHMTLSPKGNTIKLESKQTPGRRISSPKTELKKLFGPRCFDVPDFLQATPSKQVETLLGVIEIPGSVDRVAELCGEYSSFPPNMPVVPAIKQGYEEISSSRRYLEKKIKALQQTCGTPPAEEELQPIDLEELYRLKDKARHRNNLEERAAQQKIQIEDLKQKLQEMEEQLAEMENELAELEPYSVAETEIEIEKAKAHNNNVAIAQERAKQTTQLLDHVKESSAMQRALTALRDYKNEIMAATRFPVPGLDIRAGKVYYNGRELKKACGAEQLLVAVGIAASEIPPEGVQALFVLDPPQLDNQSWAMLEEFAAARRIQIWIAKVTDDVGDASIFLREGRPEKD